MRQSFPDTIAARFALTIVLSLAILQLINVGSAYVGPFSDRDEWMIPARIVNIVQILDSLPETDRAGIAAVLDKPSLGVALRTTPPATETENDLETSELHRLIEAGLERPTTLPIVITRSPGAKATETNNSFSQNLLSEAGALQVNIPLSQEQWVQFSFRSHRFGLSAVGRFALIACLSFLMIGALSIVAAHMIAGPINEFGRAAERLGTGSDASPLPEYGPREIRIATRAFNRMQERLKRFIEDRTQMLAAMSHDLRTPLSRLRLRTEFIADEEQRSKSHYDLDAMSEMISATLLFARDDSRREQSTLVDLSVLVADICDDISEAGGTISFSGSRHVDVCCRPVSVRRAITNLIENAVKYGGCARVELAQEQDGVAIVVDDDGPGIPVDEQENVFAPYYRLERSRNRDSGGVGLGLAVARTVAREHGGDVKLYNRTPSGLRVRLELPA